MIEAVKALPDCRAILSAGWSAKGGGPSADTIECPDEIFEVEEVEHSYVFPLVDVALHHGGAGTTAASLRHGVPTLYVHLSLCFVD